MHCLSLAGAECACSEETRRKLAEARKGKRHSEETRARIGEARRGTRLSFSHRFNVAVAKTGSTHTEETKRKISATERATKGAMRRERLALRAAVAAQAATADLRPAFGFSQAGDAASAPSVRSAPGHGQASNGACSDGEEDEEEEEAEEAPLLDALGLEKAVIEMTSLRRQLGAWMEAQEQKHGRKPELMETSETHPYVYAKFVRYVALRELVRRSSLAIGETPAQW